MADSEENRVNESATLSDPEFEEDYEEEHPEYPQIFPTAHFELADYENWQTWSMDYTDVQYYLKGRKGRFEENLLITSECVYIAQLCDEINQRFPTQLYCKMIRFYRGLKPLDPKRLHGELWWDQVTTVRVFATRR